MHANICKTFTNATRLMIVEQLGKGEQTVTELQQSIGVRQSNLSQHLALLREKGIVATKRDGQNIYYRLSDPKILEACRLMREVLIDQVNRTSSMVAAKK